MGGGGGGWRSLLNLINSGVNIFPLISVMNEKRDVNVVKEKRRKCLIYH